MKLGEALSLRAKQAQKLNDLSGRIRANVMVQEGAAPAEPVETLLDEFLALSKQHSRLLYRIAVTNTTTVVGGVSIASMLQTRQEWIRERQIYAMAATAATPRLDRYSRSELKYEAQIDVVAYHGFEDEANEQVRVLDAQIQELNWNTDLL